MVRPSGVLRARIAKVKSLKEFEKKFRSFKLGEYVGRDPKFGFLIAEVEILKFNDLAREKWVIKFCRSAEDNLNISTCEGNHAVKRRST